MTTQGRVQDTGKGGWAVFLSRSVGSHVESFPDSGNIA